MATGVAKADRGPAHYGRDLATLGAARRDFFSRPSPFLIGGGIIVLVALRLILGELSWRDAVAVVAMLIVYPFGEWAIHVYVLHMPSFRIAGRRVESPAARNHREHHMQPNDLKLLLLEPKELAGLLLLSVPLTVAVGALLVGVPFGAVPFGALVSAAAAGYSMVFVYEWTHFLIHTGHRPRSRLFRSISRNHRLHHFKNEHYWHGITNTVSDRVLGTNPDHRSVPRSQMARTLDPGRSD
jgi:fatty acid hydroxylase family protein